MPILDDGYSSALITTDPFIKPNAPININSINDETYKNILIDNKFTPINSLVQHVEGASWFIDYYSQIKTTDSQLNGQQITADATTQQYNKITKLEIKVSSPLSMSQDNDTKAVNYTGTALIYAGLIPNEGDMFIANVGEGQHLIFMVSSTVKKSVFLKSVYEITYNSTTTDINYIKDLEIKVINRYEFRKDFITYGQDPVIISKDAGILDDLEYRYQVLCKQYFPRFFSREFKTLIVPGQHRSIYDPFITEYISKMFSVNDAIEIQQLRTLNVQDDPVMNQSNIWTALLNREMTYLETGFNKTCLVSARSFKENPFVAGIRYTGIDFVVYPYNPTVNIDGVTRWSSKLPYPERIKEVSPVIGDMVTPANILAVQDTTIPGIYPVMMDNHYVLSHNFYCQTDTQSVLENSVSLFLQGKEIDLIGLAETAKLFMKWGVLEQFYYTPILLLLIRSGIRTYRG